MNEDENGKIFQNNINGLVAFIVLTILCFVDILLLYACEGRAIPTFVKFSMIASALLIIAPLSIGVISMLWRKR